jgi:hypothetical protein
VDLHDAPFLAAFFVQFQAKLAGKVVCKGFLFFEFDKQFFRSYFYEKI